MPSRQSRIFCRADLLPESGLKLLAAQFRRNLTPWPDRPACSGIFWNFNSRLRHLQFFTEDTVKDISVSAVLRCDFYKRAVRFFITMKADIGKSFSWKKREYESQPAISGFAVVIFHPELNRRRCQLIDEKGDDLVYWPCALINARLSVDRGRQGHYDKEKLNPIYPFHIFIIGTLPEDLTPF